MSRNTPPITVRLNNTVIFAKGSNWVCPEIFYGTLTYERYREQLELVKKPISIFKVLGRRGYK